MHVRVRFPPSPTGFLHIGSVRTALYNWLFARHHGGTAVFRIEDTDTSRETEGAIEQIRRSLDWVGLDFDEGPTQGGDYGPYRQTLRLDRYRAVAQELVERGLAYPCYQSPEELEAARALARETDDPASPTRAHRELSRAQIAEHEAAGRRPVIRFKTPLEGTTTIDDLVRGAISFEHRLLGDTVLLRADGAPTYQLANPVDDMDHRITHVIRGEDLLPSTPRQRLLVEALGGTYPQTAHLAMVLGPDRKRLSKRHGATSVEEFRDAGYLPEAVVNYLALVGWSYDDHTEVMSMDELVQRFSLERVNPAPGVFDHKKLAWMNGIHLRALDAGTYAGRLRSYLRDGGSALADEPGLEQAVPLVQEKIGVLAEFEDLAGFLFRPVVLDPASLERVRGDAQAGAILAAAATSLRAVEPFDVEGVEAALRALCETLAMKPKQAFLPLRVAVSGSTVSPGLFESIALLGREESVARIEGLAGALG